MRYMLFALIFIFLLAACTTAQPEPTSTPLPPTEPPSPTDTSGPPTQAPKPHAEEVLLAFAEAINNQEYEEITSFFSEDVTLKLLGTHGDKAVIVYEGQEIDSWLEEAEEGRVYYGLSEFVVDGDSVEFKWFWRYMLPWETEDFEKEMCEGYATMEEDNILYLEMSACN